VTIRYRGAKIVQEPAGRLNRRPPQPSAAHELTKLGPSRLRRGLIPAEGHRFRKA